MLFPSHTYIYGYAECPNEIACFQFRGNLAEKWNFRAFFNDTMARFLTDVTFSNVLSFKNTLLNNIK